MAQQSMLRGNGYVFSRDLNPKYVTLESLKPLGRETRKHSPAQIRKLQASLEEFGFVLPVVIDTSERVIAGWGLVRAAGKLGLGACPSIRDHRFRREFDSEKAAIKSRTFHCGYRSEHR